VSPYFLTDFCTAWRVAVNISNKQLQIANKGWSSMLGVGQGTNNSSMYKPSSL